MSQDLREAFYIKENAMKRRRASCIGALIALLIGGSSLIFLVPFGGVMIAGIPPVFDRLMHLCVVSPMCWWGRDCKPKTDSN